MNFTQLRNEGIREDVLIGVNKLGFIETTPVQEQAIPLILSGKDVLVQAPTGTGKTIANVFPGVKPCCAVLATGGPFMR